MSRAIVCSLGPRPSGSAKSWSFQVNAVRQNFVPRTHLHPLINMKQVLVPLIVFALATCALAYPVAEVRRRYLPTLDSYAHCCYSRDQQSKPARSHQRHGNVSLNLGRYGAIVKEPSWSSHLDPTPDSRVLAECIVGGVRTRWLAKVEKDCIVGIAKILLISINTFHAPSKQYWHRIQLNVRMRCCVPPSTLLYAPLVCWNDYALSGCSFIVVALTSASLEYVAVGTTKGGHGILHSDRPRESWCHR